MNKVRIIDIIKRLDHLKSMENRSGGPIETSKLKGLEKLEDDATI